MKSRTPSDRAIDLAIGAATLLFTTLAFLVSAPAFGAIALVTGGVTYGILIARTPRE